MMLSIRKFLLINLLVAMVCVTSLSGLADYYLTKTDVQSHMDALLEQIGLSFQVLVGDDISVSEIQRMQTDFDQVLDKTNRLFYAPDEKESSLVGQSKYHFQIWTMNGKLLLHSVNASNIDLDKANPGLNDIVINNHKWRVFKAYDDKTHLYFIVGERYDIRNQLTRRIAENNFYVMLVAYPLAGLLIWLIIGWGLKSLHRVTNEVKNRAPTYLEPVDLQFVPVEVSPLIDELNQLFLRLRQAFEREKRFAADAAHELRTPLAALKTQAQVALKTHDEGERQTLLQNIILGVDRGAHIVQQLLTLSRLVPEASGVYDMMEVNFLKLVTETIAQLAPAAVAKHIEIELDAPENNVFVKGNITGLSILIRNLIDNAIRYTPDKGSVRVAVIEEPESILLRVTDTGPGIPAELRSRVFERFYRVVGSSVAGSGLGLAIVQQIARLHHADVKLGASPTGKGLQVEVRLLKYGC